MRVYLTRVGTLAGAGAEDSGVVVFSVGSLSLTVPSSAPLFCLDSSSFNLTTYQPRNSWSITWNRIRQFLRDRLDFNLFLVFGNYRYNTPSE